MAYSTCTCFCQVIYPWMCLTVPRHARLRQAAWHSVRICLVSNACCLDHVTPKLRMADTPPTQVGLSYDSISIAYYRNNR